MSNKDQHSGLQEVKMDPAEKKDLLDELHAKTAAMICPELEKLEQERRKMLSGFVNDNTLYFGAS